MKERKVLAIDPGTLQSAFVILGSRSEGIYDSGLIPNTELVEYIKLAKRSHSADHLVVEMLKSYGMVMGDTCLMTCLWVGRFIQAWDSPSNYSTMHRKGIVTELCGSPRAKDKNVRQALIDRYALKLDLSAASKANLGKNPSIGTKQNPGPLYGFKTDMWAALGVAIAYNSIARREIEISGVLQ